MFFFPNSFFDCVFVFKEKTSSDEVKGCIKKNKMIYIGGGHWSEVHTIINEVIFKFPNKKNKV